MKTLYDLLGIEPTATQSQIEQGYRKRLDHYLARQGVGEPDKETRRMQVIREAYLLLCSPQRRQSYDQQLRIYQKARAQISNRANRKLIAFLMVVAVAVVVGVYMHRMKQSGANPSAQEISDRSAIDNAIVSIPDGCGKVGRQLLGCSKLRGQIA
jgi:curved DNA-binding protein CbpA